MRKILFIATAILLVTACGMPSGGREATPVTVETMNVQESDVSSWAYSYSRLEGVNQADIYGYSGTVESILVVSGDSVEAGELLMVLSTDSESTSNANAAAAIVNSAEAALAQSNDNLERVTTLHEAGGMSDQELLNAQLSAEIARGSLNSAQASFSGTASRTENSRVTAPFSGVVGRINITIGDPVSSVQPLLTVASPELLRAEVLLPEDALGKIETGDIASVTVSSLDGETTRATVTSVAPFIDPATGLLAVEVSIRDETGFLVPGMAAEIAVRLDVHNSVVAVPELSLISGTRGYQIAVEENGIARLRDATVGYRENGLAEIVSGLELGESLIVAGQQLVSDGSPVVTTGTGELI